MTQKELEQLNQDIIAVIDHFVDMIAAFTAAVKPNASVFEVKGLAFTTLHEAFDEYENKHGIKQLPEVGKIESSQTDGTEPGLLQDTGESRGEEESPQGNSQNDTGEASGSTSKK